MEVYASSECVKASKPTEHRICFGIVFITCGSIIETVGKIFIVYSAFLSLVAGLVKTAIWFPSLPVPQVVGIKIIVTAFLPCFSPKI